MGNNIKPPDLIIDKHNRLGIAVRDTGIHMLIALHGEISTFFYPDDKEKALYMTVADAIAWHEKEYKGSHGMSGSLEIANALRLIQDKYDKNELAIIEQ